RLGQRADALGTDCAPAAFVRAKPRWFIEGERRQVGQVRTAGELAGGRGRQPGIRKLQLGEVGQLRQGEELIRALDPACDAQMSERGQSEKCSGVLRQLVSGQGEFLDEASTKLPIGGLSAVVGRGWYLPGRVLRRKSQQCLQRCPPGRAVKADEVPFVPL